MLSNWLSSWYQQNEQQQQQQRQSQQESSFQHIEQTVGEGEEDWVQVITPSVRQQKPPSDTVAIVPHSVTTIADSNMTSATATATAAAPAPAPATIATPTTSSAASTNDGNVKGLSRQERRAKARFAVREMKKQARNAAMVTGRNKKGLASSTCLPASPITA
ncbi:hypothetical protein MUCCIDRAFT_156523 [Mucor lusitanicus CBS 277.49]|uniref:Uncharacterized protein n=1 Tax=Mucor lusitanicus CBS 277.49 TaxID=747725 RepID=A0A162QIV8_MUCCL|nr:hypothetical protein MUCCIDRAFT_156523 [Mucor lusitanicus CBS 277.49]